MIRYVLFLLIACAFNIGVAQVSFYQNAVKAEVKSGSDSLAFTSAVGFGIAYETRFLLEVPVRFAYELNASGGKLLMHGPAVQLGWTLIGGRNKSVQQDNIKIDIKYPFALQIFAGIFGKFHDFSPLQSPEQRAFSSSGRLSAQGVLPGLSTHLQLDIPFLQSISCYVGIGTAYGLAPQISSQASLKSFELKFGAQFAQ